ncbi:MAG TPA: hypothetical protein PLE75_06860 [Ferruginibacter sp.]|nr:hypothetical protein [Ferruginibacter sp.]HRO06384.1 hypothetical protein [Ferruginibacter sp.]HRO96528.1 hypothetical protein [Ferruginibacter sp.]HRP50141.1 hypothetical protein [Ferruginibacter sp.]
MKKVIFSMFFCTISMLSFASVNPVKHIDLNVKSLQSCTVTVFGLYQEPNNAGFTDVSCTKSGATCEEATALATDCRNQNICRRVFANGLTPSPHLGCKTDVLVGP